jgi:hypothetical protein
VPHFPRFDGENPLAWTYKVNQFFDYYQTPLYQCIYMASFHMESEVLVWFQDTDEAGQFPTWDTFIQALLTNFLCSSSRSQRFNGSDKERQRNINGLNTINNVYARITRTYI